MQRTLPTFLGIAMLAVTLGACGGGSGGSKAPTDANVVVQAKTGNTLDKAEYTATAGTVKIAYIGEPSANHTLLVSSEDGTAVGKTLKVQPDGEDEGSYDLKPGTYKMLCNVPGHTNMHATLVVT